MTNYSPVAPGNSSAPPSPDVAVVGSGCRKNKPTLMPVLLVLVPCLIAITVLTALAIKWRSQLDAYTKPCHSVDCIITSGEILKKSNFTADPCADFYEYACGSFNYNSLFRPGNDVLLSYSDIFEENNLKMYKLLTDESVSIGGKNSTAVAKLKMLYYSCLETDEIEELEGQPLLDLIEELGGWPLLGDSNWNKSKWDVENTLTILNKLGIFPFFTYAVLPDFHNSSLLDIKFIDAEWSYSNRNVYNESKDKSSLHKEALINYIYSLAKLLGANINISEAEEIWNLEKNLAGASLSLEEYQASSPPVEKTTLEETNKIIGNWINLTNLVSNVFGKDILPSENVTIADVDFLKNLRSVVEKTDARILANYVVWIGVKQFVPHLSNTFQLVEQSFNRVLSGQSTPTARWKNCLYTSIDAMGFALGGLFIEKYFEEVAKKQIEDIFSGIIDTFRKVLSTITWLDDQTRQKALEKLDKMTKKLGYPEFIKNPELLDMYYERLSVDTQYFQNIVNVMYFDSYFKNSKYGNLRDRNEWHLPPTEFNAYYDRTSNEIVLLAGLLQKPLFSEVFPKSYNYGRIGFIMAHEMIHGFDSKGRFFNSDGNLVNWWSEQSRQEFENKSECFVKQYSSYHIFGQNTSGLLTLSEDIADNGGLSLSFNSYKEWLKNNRDKEVLLPGLGLTHEQLFFLSFAQYFCSKYRKEKALELLEIDVHSNNKIRLIATLQNSKGFATSFKCPANSPMNPKTKCSIW